jgi:hypothetical protein
MECHARVLTDYGITNISTNNSTWMHSPSVYCVVAENENGEMVGGGRLHLTDGIEPLPAEKAVGDQDPKMAELIYSYPLGTTGELCGLWNNRRVASLGVSVLVIRSIIAIAAQLKMLSMFTLCAPYTVYLAEMMGFDLEEQVGDKGVFTYRTINHRSRFFHNSDIMNLHFAEEISRNRIFELRQEPKQPAIEKGPKHPVEILYNLEIPNIRLCNNNPVIAKVPGIFSTQRTAPAAL